MEKGRILLASVTALTLVGSACSKKEPPTLDQVRPVMAAFLDAQRDSKNSKGTFWRDTQPQVDRTRAMKALGVDLGQAPDFEFTIDPPESGMDPKLRVTARGKGEASSVALTCVQNAGAEKPECTESAAS